MVGFLSNSTLPVKEFLTTMRVMKALVLFLLAGVMAGQQPRCELPKTTFSNQKNIFSEEQENWLGEVLTDAFQHQYHVIYDPNLNSYLQRVGRRVLENLPPTKIQFQFHMVDLPETNAFTLPGGNVYVTRKLIAFAKTEDELASVLAHEMGHNLTHQGAIDMTRVFKAVLGVTSITDKADIEEKFHRVLDTAAKKNPGGGSDSETHQLVADEMALYALALSGYDTKAFAGFWDRFAKTEGKTGGFWSDLFGTTSPESKRLREALKLEPEIPANCRVPRVAAREDFAAWQAKVVAFHVAGRAEALHAVLSTLPLSPALRDEISYVRFSPDGKYLMAQDDAGIFLLRREPLANLFHIDAADARQAKFSADSKTISFLTTGLRIETWDIEQQTRLTAAEVSVTQECLSTDLSPDGKYLACVSLAPHPSWDNAKIDFGIYDVSSSAAVYERKNFNSFPFPESIGLWLQTMEGEDTQDLFALKFSPGGRYVAVARNNDLITVDMNYKQPITVSPNLKGLMNKNFAFLSDERVLGMNDKNPDESALVEFPSGRLIAVVAMGRQSIEAATHGDYAMMRPIKDFAVGVVDLKKNDLFMSYKRAAFDIYDDIFVTDTPASEIQLARFTGPQVEPKGLLALPKSPLSTLRAFALSRDGKYLALAERTQAAVWDLEKNQRLLHLRSIRGGYFSDDGKFYALFPTFNETKPQLVSFDLRSGGASSVASFEKDDRVMQFDDVLLVRHSQGKALTAKTVWEFHDAKTGAKLWERSFSDDIPALDEVGQAIVLRWSRRERSFLGPSFDAHIAPFEEKIELVDTRTGALKGKLTIDTGRGSFSVKRAVVSGDTVVITDNRSRTLLYSLQSGKEIAHFFGNHPVPDAALGLLLLRNEADELQVIDLKSGIRKDRLIFPAEIAATTLVNDGKKLFVLTDDQIVYWIDLTAAAQSESPAQPAVTH